MTICSSDQITIMELSEGTDTIIKSDTEPTDKSCMWLDTSQDPPILKNYDSEEEIWVVVSDMNKINEAITSSESRTNAMIEQSSNKIIATVREDYYAKSDTDELIASMKTEFDQTSAGFEMRFDQFNTDLANAINGTNSQFQNISKYIRFEDGNIILGELSNTLVLKIQNDRISFLHNNNEVAYFTNNKLYVTDGEYTNSLQIGKFAFRPGLAGDLSFGKIID